MSRCESEAQFLSKFLSLNLSLSLGLPNYVEQIDLDYYRYWRSRFNRRLLNINLNNRFLYMLDESMKSSITAVKMIDNRF
jgi:hypothetical protein